MTTSLSSEVQSQGWIALLGAHVLLLTVDRSAAALARGVLVLHINGVLVTLALVMRASARRVGTAAQPEGMGRGRAQLARWPPS